MAVTAFYLWWKRAQHIKTCPQLWHSVPGHDPREVIKRNRKCSGLSAWTCAILGKRWTCAIGPVLSWGTAGHAQLDMCCPGEEPDMRNWTGAVLGNRTAAGLWLWGLFPVFWEMPADCLPVLDWRSLPAHPAEAVGVYLLRSGDFNQGIRWSAYHFMGSHCRVTKDI